MTALREIATVIRITSGLVAVLIFALVIVSNSTVPHWCQDFATQATAYERCADSTNPVNPSTDLDNRR